MLLCDALLLVKWVGNGKERIESIERLGTGVSFWDGTVARRNGDEMATLTFQDKITLYPRYFFYCPTCYSLLNSSCDSGGTFFFYFLNFLYHLS